MDWFLLERTLYQDVIKFTRQKSFFYGGVIKSNCKTGTKLYLSEIKILLSGFISFPIFFKTEVISHNNFTFIYLKTLQISIIEVLNNVYKWFWSQIYPESNFLQSIFIILSWKFNCSSYCVFNFIRISEKIYAVLKERNSFGF